MRGCKSGVNRSLPAVLSSFHFAAQITTPFFKRHCECCFRLLLRLIRRGYEIVTICGQKLFALGADFCGQFLERIGLRGNVLIGLLGRGKKACRRFFGLLADFAQCFSRAGELFGVRSALHTALIREVRGEVARHFFELRSKALR